MKTTKLVKSSIIALSILVLAGVSSHGEQTVTIAFGGDTLFGGYYSLDPRYGTMNELTQMIDRYIQRHGEELGVQLFTKYIFCNIRSIFERADYGVVNLEGPITATGKNAYPKVFPLRQHLQAPSILKEAGIAVVSLANNHAYDFNGAYGLEETMLRLETVGIAYVGAGSGQDAYAKAFSCVVKESNGVKVAFFGITDVIEPGNMIVEAGKTGVAALPEQAGYRQSTYMHTLLRNIVAAKERADFTVVLLHAGPHRGNEVIQGQREIIDILLEHGVDVIIGAHCHARQPAREVTDEGGRIRQVAFYGLGNLIFGGSRASRSPGLIPLITFRKEDATTYLTYETFTIRPGEEDPFQPYVVE